MAASKRKRSSLQSASNGDAVSHKRQAPARKASSAAAMAVNPDANMDILDAPNATRASPDNAPNLAIAPEQPVRNERRSESPLSDAPDVVEPPKSKKQRGRKAAAVNGIAPAGVQTSEKKAKGKKKVVSDEEDADGSTLAAAPTNPSPKIKSEGDAVDPEAEGNEDASPEELKEALTRPPPVNSPRLPLPWKGRLGYACLNTYLRASNPPIFSSRTCRIQSILEHRYPLTHPDEPEHPTKNRPDRSKPMDVDLGRQYVENICLANVRDIAKMIRWNEKYCIRFLRLSSEIFPFASHSEYGYKLAPFASEALAEAGKVIAELGHRVTTHPGQFTQLGSPRKPVIENAIRDLVYHDEMLSLLKLPEQQNRDAVMILHMGGVFESKEATLDRFREYYANLSDSVKRRLVLENDDVCYSAHDILPICEELNIPFVLDFHHHNILFDSSQIREGTADIVELFPRILATWKRKGITPKMHYSEPTPAAITPRQRRKHNPRVYTLPPCPDNMDLMIEAKDKEQAVFELMRNFKLPGYDTFNEVIPYERRDDNKYADSAAGQRKISKGENIDIVPEGDVAMGGREGRVYWPPGMEEYLRPKKREVVIKAPANGETVDPSADESKKKEKRKIAAAEAYAQREAMKVDPTRAAVEEDSDPEATPATRKAKAAMKKKANEQALKKAAKQADTVTTKGASNGKKPARKATGRAAKKSIKYEEEEEEEEEEDDENE